MGCGVGKFLDKMAGKIREGKIVCGVCVSLNDPAVSELVGMAGYDFVWIEGEHGAMGRAEMQNLMIGAHAGSAAAMVRFLMWMRPWCARCLIWGRIL